MEKKKLTCIIVEDEKAYQQIIMFFVSKIPGLEVLGAYFDTVNAAIQIERKKPDLIFLDINISGLEGPEFIELLEYRPKIIIVSGHTEEFMNAHYNVPYHAYIQKPIDLDKLKNALKAL